MKLAGVAALAAALAVAVALAACGGKTSGTVLDNKAGPGIGSSSTGGATGATTGEARVIQRNQSGGTIEIRGDRAAVMGQTNQEMAAHCGPDNYTVTQEGEEAIDPDGTGTRTATAWRVHYQCNGAAAPPSP